MADKRDAARITAETLVSMLMVGGAAATTAVGSPVVLSGMGAAAVNGIFKFLIAKMLGMPDPNDILQRIQNKRMANTVETIRDALVEAMNLKPEFAEPIEELADAVQAREGGRDEQRFRTALLKLLDVVMQVTAKLDDIKADTVYIPEIHSIAKDTQDRIKRIEAAVVGPEIPDEGEHGTQRYLKMRVESLTSEVRDLLDANGKQKWDHIAAAMAEHSWRQAFELAVDLERWLDEQGDKISPNVKVQGLLTLADVTVIRDSGFPFDDTQDVAEASRLLAKAEAAATPDLGEETAARLLRVRAKLTYIKGNRDEAHEILDSLSDPGAISLKLGMMEEESRWSEASDLAAAQNEPHKKWAASAIAAHIEADRIDRAEDILEWAKDQESLMRKSCSLVFVKSKYSKIFREGTGTNQLSLIDKSREVLGQLLKMLDETFGAAFKDGPSSGIDAEALEMAILLGHFLREFQVCQNVATQLVKWRPVMPELGRSVLRGDISKVDGLADRFLDEHGNTFLTQMLAVMLLIEMDHKAEKALRILIPLMDRVDTCHHEEIATSMLIATQYCDLEIGRTAYQRVAKTLGADHRLAIMLNAILLAKAGSLPEARVAIEPLANNDDHIWLQLAASFATQQKAWTDAAKLLHQAGELTGHAEVYCQEAEAWYHAGNLANCVEPLEKALQLLPDDRSIIRNLAAAYHGTGRFANAANKYEMLWRTGEHTQPLTINYSNALVLSGKVVTAIEVLKTYLSEAGDQADMVPLLGCAHLLHTQDDAKAALELLLRHWSRFDGDHRYLMAVMQLGYASGREEDAHKAFEKLVGMLDKGALPEGVLTRCSFDDMFAMHRQWNERRQHVDGLYLSGRLPWLIASNWIQPSNHCYLSWLVRTQPLIPADHPENAAEYSLYSTNGFTAVDVGGHRCLAPIAAPEKPISVVVDMSALMTLHRIGLLEEACAYFDKVYLPQSYRAAWIEEQARIPHHQPRQIESRQAVVRAVREGRMAVATTIPVGTPMLDEYEVTAHGSTTVVRILQVANWLVAQGKISAEQRAAVQSKHNQPPIVTDDEANTALASGVVLAKSLTLQTCHELGILDNLCRGMRVFVEANELQELENALRNQAASDQSGGWYRELIAEVNRIENIEFAPVGVSFRTEHDQEANDDRQEGRTAIQFGIDAVLLAQQTNLPLLADDRHCQQALLSSRPQDGHAAFGTDALIRRLGADGKVAMSGQASHFMQLIRWRYKFLLPDACILLEMASRFREGLPGMELREVAVYVQDCMRDFGLYGGFEQTKPPTSMAMKLFKGWIDVLADFIVCLWWDDRFTEEQAARLTRWATRYLLPAWPRSMSAPVWRKVAYIRRYALLGGVIAKLLYRDDVRKANRVVRRVVRTMAAGDEEVASAAESISETLATVLDEQGEQTVVSLFVRVLDIVYGRRSRISWRLLPLAHRLGLVNLSKDGGDISAEHVSVLADRNHSNRLEPKVGPFAYSREGAQAVALFLPDVLCMVHTSLRRAACSNLMPREFCPKTTRTQAALQQEVAAIGSDNVDVWVPAASRVHEMVREDLLLNLAGFAQTQKRRHPDGSTLCWNQLIHPTAESLLAIDDHWNLLIQNVSESNSLNPLLTDSSGIEELLSRYDQYMGHLTLAPPLDLGSQLRKFVEAHGYHDQVWTAIQIWLQDQHSPWRQYHAIEALLTNIDYIPSHHLNEFWEAVTNIAALSLAANMDSDEVQVWRLEAELASHYLKAVDLGGYGLEENRPLTASWWVARAMTKLLVSTLNPGDIAATVREWRTKSILRQILIVRDSWVWLSPKVFSSARFATLYETSPRSVALLVAFGNAIKNIELQSISVDKRKKLQDCFCSALLIADATPKVNERRLWMWDQPLLDAAKSYFSALPPEDLSDSAVQICAIIEKMRDAAALRDSLDQLPQATDEEAIFISSRVRMYCYGHADAADIMLSFLRKPEWCDECAIKLSWHSWELLSQGLLYLQSKQGIKWAAELPYVFLRMAEVTSADNEKSQLFLIFMVISSLSGNTIGAIKALAKSKALPALRPTIAAVRESIEDISIISSPEIGIRMQSVITALDIIT